MKKLVLLTSILFLVLMVSNCSSYKQVSLGNNEFYNNKKIPKHIKDYNVYVHEGSAVYRLANPDFSKDTLKGSLESVPAESVNAHPETESDMKTGRSQVHVYLAKRTSEISTTKDPGALVKHVAIDRTAVDRVDMFAKNEKTAFAKFGLIFGIIALGMLLTAAIIIASVNASGEAAKGSDSNSNSGDSGSGDSGGSNSGCYVATMVYGSYDAPNVLVLRAFRDRFLQRYSWGRGFISWYYRNSPRFVAKHEGKKLLGSCIRGMLNLFVWIIRPIFGR